MPTSGPMVVRARIGAATCETRQVAAAKPRNAAAMPRERERQGGRPRAQDGAGARARAAPHQGAQPGSACRRPPRTRPGSRRRRPPPARGTAGAARPPGAIPSAIQRRIAGSGDGRARPAGATRPRQPRADPPHCRRPAPRDLSSAAGRFPWRFLTVRRPVLQPTRFVLRAPCRALSPRRRPRRRPFRDPSAPPNILRTDVLSRRHALRALAHRLPAYRRGPHGVVQLALCPPHRRPDAAAHRGYRPRALHQGRHRRDPRRPVLARPRLGRRRGLPVRPRRAPPRCGRGAAGRGPRLPLLRHRRGTGADAGDGPRRGPPAALRRPLARPRSLRGARRGQAGDPPARADRGRDRGRGRRAGPGDLGQQGPRRPRPAALGRHADLHARRRGRRSRHGRHAGHPRRRPPHQRRPPDPDLLRARLGRPEDGPYPADPRGRRGQAVEAPRGARRRGLPAISATCRRPCATTWCGSAGATATRRSSPPTR